MKCSLVFLIFLKRSLVFPFLLFSSISLYWSLKKAFLSLLAILWNSGLSWVYLSFSPLPFASLLFTAIFKASSNNHFAFLHFLSFGIILITVSCTMSQTLVHRSSGTLSIRSNPLNLFSLPLYNCKGFDLGYTWMVSVQPHRQQPTRLPRPWDSPGKNTGVGCQHRVGHDWSDLAAAEQHTWMV